MAIRDSVKSLIINNVEVPFQAETLKYKIGKGDRNFESHVKGNGEIEVVVGEDTSTKIGMVGFELQNTKIGRDFVNTWQGNRNSNVVQILLEEGSLITFENMALVSDPEIPISSDSNIAVEFQGNPAKF